MEIKDAPRILYIEDEIALCELFKMSIGVHGYRVDVAQSGNDGISLFTLNPYDIVAIDYELPDMTGMDVARRLLADNPELPVLIVTGKGDEHIAAEALSLGVSNYIIKRDERVYLELIPTIISQLLEKIDRRREQIEAAAELQRSEQKYRDLVAVSPMCIHEIDLEGRFLSMNLAGLRMMGVEDEVEIRGLYYHEMSISEDRDRIIALLDEAREGIGAEFEFAMTGIDGLSHFSSSLQPIKDKSGKVIKLMGMTQDITARKRAGLALDAHVAMLQGIFDNTPVCMNLKDTTGRYVLINKPYAAWYGLSPEDIIGKQAHQFYFDLTRADTVSEVEKAVVETGETIQQEVKIRGIDGNFYERSVTKFLVKTADETPDLIGTVAIDITERKVIEKSLQTAFVAAEQANQAKSGFLATMSHEFRTPLNAILGFSDMIRTQSIAPLEDQKTREYANDIHDSGQHMLGLVNDVLDMAAIEAGERGLSKEACSVGEVVNECLAIVRHAASERDIELSFDIPDDLPTLYADSSSLRQIFLNLLSNGIKFTSEEGRIGISARASNHEITIKVTDTGIGIPSDNLADVTKPFTKLNDDSFIAHNGTGLGLSIVDSLVELHDGEMSIESEINEGTTVTVIFPRREPMN